MTNYPSLSNITASNIEIYSYFSNHITNLLNKGEVPKREINARKFARTPTKHIPVYESKFAYDNVYALAEMPDDWDGYGAPAFQSSTIENSLGAIRGLLNIAPAPEITPNPNGTVSFERETSSGVSHLEIGEKKFSFYLLKESQHKFIMDGYCNQADFHLMGNFVNDHLYPQSNRSPTMSNASISRIAA